jgi:hypothetical protein
MTTREKADELETLRASLDVERAQNKTLHAELSTLRALLSSAASLLEQATRNLVLIGLEDPIIDRSRTHAARIRNQLEGVSPASAAAGADLADALVDARRRRSSDSMAAVVDVDECVICGERLVGHPPMSGEQHGFIARQEKRSAFSPEPSTKVEGHPVSNVDPNCPACGQPLGSTVNCRNCVNAAAAGHGKPMTKGRSKR